MRFLLYNIRYAAGIGRRFHLPVPYSGYIKNTSQNLKHIVDFIRSIDPDIIGLIEVDSGSFRSEKNNQAESIAWELQLKHIYQSKYAVTSMTRRVPLLNKQGNAILTRLPIVSQKFHYFREGVKRLVIEAELEDVTVFLVHLSLKFRHRQHQLQDLYNMIRKTDKPKIVAGDFNVFWGDRELQLFLAATGLVSANGEGRPSHPSRAPRRQLDYIFHSPELQTVSFEVPRIQLSDHAPLVWDFDFSEKDRPARERGRVSAQPPQPKSG